MKYSLGLEEEKYRCRVFVFISTLFGLISNHIKNKYKDMWKQNGKCLHSMIKRNMKDSIHNLLASNTFEIPRAVSGD